MELERAALSQARRARVTVAFLWACLGLAAVSLVTGLWLAFAAGQAADGLATGDTLGSAEALHQLAEGLQAFAFLGSAVAWLVWSARAYGNLRRFGSGQARHGTAWVLGAWFIPIANLVGPYQVTKELWLRSRDGNAAAPPGAQDAPALLTLWWGAWIVMNLLARFSDGLLERATDLEATRRAALVGAVSGAVTAGAALAALLVVKQIDQHQRAAVARARAAEVFG